MCGNWCYNVCGRTSAERSGLGIREDNIDNFIAATDKLLKDMSDEPMYYVDYIYNGVDIKSSNILLIASLEDLWGKDMDESLVAIENLKITKDMITLMSPDKKPTLKISLPDKISLIKFNSNQEEYENLLSDTGSININIIGKCSKNEWMGNISAQILIEDYEIIGKSKYCF